jgi:hypothetical protein
MAHCEVTSDSDSKLLCVNLTIDYSHVVLCSLTFTTSCPTYFDDPVYRKPSPDRYAGEIPSRLPYTRLARLRADVAVCASLSNFIAALLKFIKGGFKNA